MGRTQYLLWLSDPEMQNKDNTSLFDLPVLDLPSPMATPDCSSQEQYVTTYGDSCTCIQVPEKQQFVFIFIIYSITHQAYKPQFQYLYVKVFQVKVVPLIITYNTMKAHGGVKGVTTFLNLAPHGLEWSDTQFVALPTYPLYRQLCRSQSHSGHFRDENYFFTLKEIELQFIICPACRTVSTSNELSCLLPVVSSLTNTQIYLNACMTP
jgi:hypothetical protein